MPCFYLYCHAVSHCATGLPNPQIWPFPTTHQNMHLFVYFVSQIGVNSLFFPNSGINCLTNPKSFPKSRGVRFLALWLFLQRQPCCAIFTLLTHFSLLLPPGLPNLQIWFFPTTHQNMHLFVYFVSKIGVNSLFFSNSGINCLTNPKSFPNSRGVRFLALWLFLQRQPFSYQGGAPFSH